MIRKRWMTFVSGVVAALMIVACSTTPRSASAKRELYTQADAVVQRFQERDSAIKTHMEKAYGYVVFPSVTKGGAGIGGAYGRGAVFEQGKFVGYADLTQGTIGLQLGGQEYSELILFQDKAALESFKAGNMELSAQASAIAAAEGDSSNANYEDGVLVYTLGRGGLMFEASVGGQKFSFANAEGPPEA